VTEDLDRARDREAALREMLDVISRSRDDEAPVFDVILRNAAQLCKAPIARLWLVGTAGTQYVQAASYGESLPSLQNGETWPMDPRGAVTRSIRGARSFHTHDVADTDGYRRGDTDLVRMVDDEGLRTELSVPLMRDGVGFGAVILNRRAVDPFDDADIALVETFATQAVIAIENVRQFRELPTRLAREAATREILEVISQSHDDDRPVFDAILRRAAHLCNAHAAALALGKAGDRQQRLVATYGVDPATVAVYDRGEVSMDPDISQAAQAILTGKVIDVDDMMKTEGYRRGVGHFVSVVRDSGIRSQMFAPLITAAGGIGCFIIFRKEVRPFTADEIGLAETFPAPGRHRHRECPPVPRVADAAGA